MMQTGLVDACFPAVSVRDGMCLEAGSMHLVCAPMAANLPLLKTNLYICDDPSVAA